MVSPLYARQATADEQDDPFLYLLTIAHDDLPDGPMRFVRDYNALVSRSLSFDAYPFDVKLPGAGDNGVTAASIVIDNIDQRIVQTLRVLTTSPTLLIEQVVASTPDAVEMSLPLFKLTQVSADRFAVQADLTRAQDDTQPLCRDTFTPATAPALVN